MYSTNTGTWNIMTLLKPDKMQELAEQIVNTQSEVHVIQETRWNENGLIEINSCSLY
jgi:hypothetical protein